MEEDPDGQAVQQSQLSRKDSTIDHSESYSAPASAKIAVVTTTTTVTTAGVIPLTTSANITLTGFRWTDSTSKDRKQTDNGPFNNIASLLPQSPSIVSRIKQLYSQQDTSSRRSDEDERRFSLISNDNKCDHDESGRSFICSSSDDTQSIATTTSANGTLINTLL